MTISRVLQSGLRIAAVLMGTGCIAHGFGLPTAKRIAAVDIIGQVANCRFDEANARIDSLVRADPGDPFLYVLRMTAIGLRDLDYDCSSDSAGYADAYLSVVRTSARLPRRTALDSSYALTMGGFADAMYASFCLRQKQYGAGVRVGLDGLKQLRLAKECDARNYDVDFFLGFYECAKADLRRRLWWVLFWSQGSVADGIARLERCVREAQFAGIGAAISLADVYTSHGQYDKAATLIDGLFRAYPESRFAMWARARYHTARSEHAQAAAVYDQLTRQYATIPAAVRSRAQTWNSQAHSLELAGKLAESSEQCGLLLAALGQNPDPAIRDIIRDTQRLRDRIARNDHS